MANTLSLFRNGAVGFIDGLDARQLLPAKHSRLLGPSSELRRPAPV
jgi:hypothetical protein